MPKSNKNATITPSSKPNENGLTNNDLAQLETLGLAAIAANDALKIAKGDDRAATSAFRDYALWCGLQVKTSADKIALNKTLTIINPTSKKTRERLSQTINHPAVHKMLAKNNGGKIPETPDDVSKSLGYVDNRGNEQVHTLTSLSDSRPHSPITLDREQRKHEASADKAADRTLEVSRNPVTGKALTDIRSIADELRQNDVLSDEIKSDANRSKYEAFISTNIEMLYEMIHVE